MSRAGNPRVEKAIVSLTAGQRATLERFVHTGTQLATLRKRAHILLKADVNGPHGGQPDERIADAVDTTRMTVMTVRQQFVAQGLEACLQRKRPAGRQYRKLDGRQEAQLLALTCSAPPEGQARWTMELLADKLVEMNVVDAIHPSTVCRTLQKTSLSPGSSSSGSSRRRPATRRSSRRWRTS